LKELAGLGDLQFLYAAFAQITDVGMKDIGRLKKLRWLYLGGNHEVTDAGLKELGGLADLQMLYLNMTQVSDKGLQELAGLNHLRFLAVGGSQVTDSGVAEFQKALPRCTVYDGTN
jgi:hypothetical protein